MSATTLQIPAVRQVAERAYRMIAGHRRPAARVTAVLWGGDKQPPAYALARWWFFRLLGIVYMAAFASLAAQIVGLVGHDGILPADVADVWLRGVSIAGAALGLLLA